MMHGIGETENTVCQEELLSPGTFLTQKIATTFSPWVKIPEPMKDNTTVKH